MITAIEYVTGGGRLHADKLMNERDAWHLKSIKGNGLPPTTTIGAATYGLPGKSYGGVAVDSREIDLEIYADANSAAGLQAMLADVSRVASASRAALGVLRLVNETGAAFQIPARVTSFEVAAVRRRSMLFQVVLDCPQPYFEDGVSNIVPLVPLDGGKEYPLDRPYTFGNATNASATRIDETHEVYNAGDMPAPCLFKLYGSGLYTVTLTNETTGASIAASSLGDTHNGIIINTDADNPSAVFDNGEDASRYLSLYSDLSDFVLVPGLNAVHAIVTATSVTVAGTQFEYRGRYTTCL